jgi:hypothetical protein
MRIRFRTGSRTTPAIAWSLFAWIVLIPSIACGPAKTNPDDPSISSLPTTSTVVVPQPSSPEWTVTGEDLNIVLATPDLGVGEQRFALVLSDQQGLIKFPVVELTSYRYENGYDSDNEGPVETMLARFAEFPFRTRGIHVTTFSFDTPGNWGVKVHVPRTDGSTASAEVRFSVAEHSRSIAVGEPAPPSKNRTLSDVKSASELTTGSIIDESLYETTIADAIHRQRPFVVVFASPAFCTNAVCGPQVEVASALREKYGDKADFIHVDLYENPQEIQGDLASAIKSPLLSEWGLTSQEWTYVVSANGKVTARFENFVGEDELEQAIKVAIENAHNA